MGKETGRLNNGNHGISSHSNSEHANNNKKMKGGPKRHSKLKRGRPISHGKRSKTYLRGESGYV
jgi:hypothetical protein